VKLPYVITYGDTLLVDGIYIDLIEKLGMNFDLASVTSSNFTNPRFYYLRVLHNWACIAAAIDESHLNDPIFPDLKIPMDVPNTFEEQYVAGETRREAFGRTIICISSASLGSDGVTLSDRVLPEPAGRIASFADNENLADMAADMTSGLC
jgi:hypothetical protein